MTKLAQPRLIFLVSCKPRFIEQRVVNHESIIFLATNDGLALGFTQLYPSFSSVSMRRLWILNDLFVAPSARKPPSVTSEERAFLA